MRQKRFRERQKSREQEESARIQASIHQQPLPPEAAQQINVQQQPPPPHSYDPSAAMQYADPTQGQAKHDDRVSPGMSMDPQVPQPQETLVEKRKRLGR